MSTTEIAVPEPYRVGDTVDDSPWPEETFPPAVARTGSGDLVLLAGRRRLTHAKLARVEKLRVYVVHDWQGFAAWLALDADAAAPFRRFKVSEVGRFLDQAAQRLGFTVKQVGKVDSVMGDIETMPRRQVADLRNLARRLRESGDPALRDDLDLVDRGVIQPTSVMSRILDRSRASEKRLIRAAADQRKRYSTVIPALRGLTEGLLDVGKFSDELTRDERDGWEKSLRQASQDLHKIIRQFKDARESTT